MDNILLEHLKARSLSDGIPPALVYRVDDAVPGEAVIVCGVAWGIGWEATVSGTPEFAARQTGIVVCPEPGLSIPITEAACYGYWNTVVVGPAERPFGVSSY